MIQRLWIPGQLPSLNDWIAAAKGAGGTGAQYAQLKRKWTETVAWLARAAKLKPVERAWFAFQWQEKTRRRDKDNVAAGGRKPIFDGLVQAHVIPNDTWAYVIGWEDSFEVVDKPGVMVAILNAAPVTNGVTAKP